MNELTEAQVKELLSDAVVARIEAMEAQMLDHEQVEMPVDDTFSKGVNGMYVRQIMIPKDTLLTGRVHLEDYVDIMLSGDISVATPDGVKRMTGLNVMAGPKGRKRAGYAHEDTYWLTVHNCPVESGDEYVNNYTVFGMKEYQRLLEGPKCQS